MVIFFANMPHYYDHIIDVYNKLGISKVIIDKVNDSSKLLNTISQYDNPIYIVPSYSLLSRLYKPNFPKNRSILLEHGVGQSYITNKTSWARGSTKYDDNIILYMATNNYCYDAFKKHHKNIPIEIIGCPKLDNIPIMNPNLEDPLICFSWHWDAIEIPETRSGFDYWKDSLIELSKHNRIVIHGHPRIQNITSEFARDNNIQFISSFNRVLELADIYVCDNSSTIYEFAVTNKPVILLNNPFYRRDINHGLRFWELSNIGINCNNNKDLQKCINMTKCNTKSIDKDIIHKVYPYLGYSINRTVEVIKKYVL